jgi:16S rRNA (guanine(1405)-N(7))-methyltransferase
LTARPGRAGAASGDEELAHRTVERLRTAPKYRQIHIDTITDIVAHEAAHAVSDADLERRARLKLHKVSAGYLLSARPSRMLRGLDEAVAAGPEALKAWCRAVLARHISTAERLASLDHLYPTILGLTGPVSSIADLACALNPFTVPWLRAATAATYTGYDLNLSYIEAGTRFLEATDSGATMRHRDVLIRPGEIRADVALLLKTYHCIENRRYGAALRLVEGLETRYVVVSFPSRTMSGRAAPFVRGYVEQLASLADRRGWEQHQADLAGEELVVLVKEGGRGQGD